MERVSLGVERVEGVSADTSACALVRRLWSAFEARDWERLRSLYHPEARLSAVATDRTPLSPEQFLESLRAVASDELYSATWYSCQAVDEACAIVNGSVRNRLPDGGFSVSTLYWLMTFCDGMLYRSVVCPSFAEAESTYRAAGVTLGLE